MTLQSKNMNVDVSELGAWLNFSRPSIYRFIKAYNNEKYEEVDNDVLAVFKFMENNPSATKAEIRKFIINDLGHPIANYQIDHVHPKNASLMDEKRLYYMGRMMDNPNALYENTSYLTPADKFLDGTNVEDHSSELSKEDISEATDRLNAMKCMYDYVKQFTRNKLSGKRVWFSDSQRSFIAEFEPEYEPEYPYIHDYTEARVILEIFAEILGKPSFSRCPLFSVSTLRDRVNDAIESIKVIENTKNPADDSKIRREVKELNNDWAVRNKVISNGWYECVAIVSTNDKEGNRIDLFLDENTGVSEQDAALALKHSVVEEYQDNFIIKGMDVFGPFTTVDEAEKIAEYLSIEWDVEFADQEDVSDDDAVKWLEKQQKKSKVLNGGFTINK